MTVSVSFPAGGAIRPGSASSLIPPVDWTQTTTPTRPQDMVVPRDTLNDSARPAEETQATLAAENAPLRVLYGQVRVGAQIAYVLSYQGDLVILAIWGQGPVDSIVSVTVDDNPPAAGVAATHYTGAPGQGIDPLLVLAFAGQSPAVTYTDTLAGICYSVLRVPAGASSGFPRVNAIIKGAKVYDPRLDSTNGGSGPQRLADATTWAWSDNPALCTADFIANTVYGMAKSVDWASVGGVANDCDALVGLAPNQEKLRTLNLALETVQPVTSWLDTLRTYAGCWAVQSGAAIKLISDKATGASVAAYDHAAGNIASLSALKKRGVQSTPTVMTVTYTDTSVLPWRDATAVVYAPGVLAGTTPRRESQVSLPGITRYSQAYREATERLNKLLLNDLSMTLGVFDEGVALEIGDVVAVTHPIGLAAKLMRVMGITGDFGRYSVNLVEYDPAVYSALVVGAPTWVDTNLPDPTAPPAVSGLALAEEVYQEQDGTWKSRIKATWSPATYAFLQHYRVELYKSSGMVLVDSLSIDPQGAPQYKSPAVADANTGVLPNYTVRVQAVSTIGAGGAWAVSTLTPAGKALLPSNVPSLTGFEVGGEVRLTIGAAFDLDMIGYEVRYGPVGCGWALSSTVKFADFVNAASGVGGYCVYKDAPTGTWDFLVCARDSIGQYSPTPARVTIAVTTDVNAFLIGNNDFSAGTPTLAGMAVYTLPCDGTKYYVTEDGVTAATKFPNTASTYGNAAAAYHAAQASAFQTAVWDIGLPVTGNWSASLSSVALNGAKTDAIQLSSDGASYTDFIGASAKTTARFARLKSTASGTDTLKVSMPAATLRADVVPKVPEKFSNVLSLAAGGTRVQLASTYTAATNITVTPLGAAPRSYTLDNILVAPVQGLLFSMTVTGGGNAYCYWSISTAARTILADDYLEYDVFVVRQAVTGFGGMEIDYSGGALRSAGASDSYGPNHVPTLPVGQWVSRKLPLAAIAGRVSTSWDLVNESDTAGEYCAVYRNIRVTNGAGTTRLSIYGTGGEPAANADAYSALVTNRRIGPANSVHVYLWSGASQVADYFNLTFAGV